ncbi:HEPN/Toprim-associated domain-containing protein [Aeromonas caviae]|uniref:HEPN/Toprim-associated domain-containing protein n=1 Tax=Aeromonas caviae TaxID=648 RepID=UPI002AB566FF|nr:HEPN/Toprim-associated domain-containing protein [Aeromonas caviae]MDY7828154.1 HEPN/Toprim-associated domain-containing protein [Aeromonas caviae]
MSSYASTQIGKQLLEVSHESYDRWYFKPSEWDRRVYYEETVGGYPKDFIGYESTVKEIRERLLLAGYDHKSLRQDFDSTKQLVLYDLNTMQELEERKGESRGTATIEEIERCYNIVSETSFDVWKETFYKMLSKESEIKNHTFDESLVDDDLLELIETRNEIYLSAVDSSYSDYFPCMQKESLALLLLDSCEDNEKCILNLTILVRDGWVDDHEEGSNADRNYLDTKFYNNFMESMNDLDSINTGSNHPVIQRMIFSTVISAMEAYLSDTLKRNVFNREGVKRRFVKIYKNFSSDALNGSDVFDYLDKLDGKIKYYIDKKMSFHDTQLIENIYTKVLHCKIDKDKLKQLSAFVDKRHDIVHRNGKDQDSNVHNISQKDVRILIRVVSDFVQDIDMQIINGLLSNQVD